MRIGLVAMGLLTACGGAPPPGAAEPPAAPLTDSDPPPYAPAPGPTPIGHTGEAQGLAADAGYEPARALAVSFFRSLIDGDSGALTGMLVESVVVGRQGRTSESRARFVQGALNHLQQNPPPPQTPLEELIETQRVSVRSPSAYAAEAPWIGASTAFADTDVVVSVPIRLVARRTFYFFAGRSEALLVIRPGL